MWIYSGRAQSAGVGRSGRGLTRAVSAAGCDAERVGQSGPARPQSRSRHYRALVAYEIVARYSPLIWSFVDGELDAGTFKRVFLEWWREDRDSGITTGQALDDLMTGVNRYDENPDVLMRIDAEQLRAEARQAVNRLTGPDDDPGEGVREPRSPIPSPPSEVAHLLEPRPGGT
jgi:hypothetical protein